MFARSALSCLLTVLASTSVSAQSYRCNSSSGTYFSDKPCNGTTSIQSYGPIRQTPQYSQTLPGVPKAQDHLKYLSSACASISEAIRTGPARGVRSDVMQGLHEEYRQKCSVEDQDARTQAQQDRSKDRQQLMAQRESAMTERKEARVRSDRCDGMRDVLALKRKREAELNAKEVEALRALEKTYNETCISR